MNGFFFCFHASVDSSIMRPQFSSIIKSVRLAIIPAPCDVLCDLLREECNKQSAIRTQKRVMTFTDPARDSTEEKPSLWTTTRAFRDVNFRCLLNCH